MATMVRKQVYIEQRQDRKLKVLARAMGCTEAEIIRKALDVEVDKLQSDQDRLAAWREERAFIEELMKKGPMKGGRPWTREELYDR